MQKTEVKKDLDKLLEEAVDEGLNVLGNSGKQMLFFHLEKSFSLKKNEILKKPETFTVAIEEIFGAGALVLERLIIKSVYSKLGLKYQEKKECTFSDFLRDVTVALEQCSQDSKNLKEELDESLRLHAET